MTIFEAQSILINWFQKNDAVFLSNNDKVKDDFTKLVTLSENPPQDRAAVLLALDDLEKATWLKKQDTKDGSYYILIKPLAAITQMVPIDIVLAKDISDLVNDLAPTDKLCDPRVIDAQDIQALLFLIYSLLEDSSEEGSETEENLPPDNISNN